MAMRQGTRRTDTRRRQRASVTSIRWSWLIAALAGGLIWTAPAQARRRGRQAPPALAPTAAHDEFARRVAIPGGRKLYLECRGTGSPTVVLEAGTGNLAEIWSEPPDGPGPAVLPGRGRVYPGVRLRPPRDVRAPRSVLSRSDPVAMPRSARDIVLDLRALLRAAHVPGPYVLAGHSFGGMVVRLYATTYPRKIAGLVSIDAQNEDFAAAYKEFLTPEQYVASVLNPQPAARTRELLGRRAARPPGQRRSDAPGAGGHAAAPDAARRPLPLPRPFRTRSDSRPTGRSRHSTRRFRIRRTSWQGSCRAPAT